MVIDCNERIFEFSRFWFDSFLAERIHVPCPEYVPSKISAYSRILYFVAYYHIEPDIISELCDAVSNNMFRE